MDRVKRIHQLRQRRVEMDRKRRTTAQRYLSYVSGKLIDLHDEHADTLIASAAELTGQMASALQYGHEYSTSVQSEKFDRELNDVAQ